MADGREVTLTFSGEHKDLDKTFASVDDGLKGVGKSLDSASDHASKFDNNIDKTQAGLENTTGKLRSTNDLVDGFASVVGLSLPPQAQMILGFADMADGMAGLLGPALKSTKAGFTAMNATMKANPILSVIAVITLLVTAFVIAYKKSETFRRIVDGSLAAVKDVAVSVADVFQDMARVIGSAFDWIADKAEWLWKYSPLGMLVGNLDKLGGAIGKVGGALHVPGFASGGQVNGLSVVGERGPELFAGKGTVIPNGRIGNGSGNQSIVLSFEGPSDPIFEAFKKQIRVRGGGNVQLALGGTR